MKLYKLALRNISRNKRRSFLSASGMAIAAFAIVFLFGFIAGVVNSMESNLWTYITGAVRIRHSDFDRYERLNPMHLSIPNYSALMDEVNRDPAVVAVSPRINFPARVFLENSTSLAMVNVMGLGVDFGLEKFYQDYKQSLVEGRLPKAGTREAVMGQNLAGKLGTGLGEMFTMTSQSFSQKDQGLTFVLVGIIAIPVKGLDNVMLQVPLDTAQEYLGLPNQIQEILIKVDTQIDSPETVATRLSQKLSWDVPLNVWDYKKINGMAAMVGLAERIYDVIAVIFFLLASTVIINTSIMVILERMKEIGTLGAMGMTKRQLVQLFFLESLFISIAGTLAGIVLGIVPLAYFGAVGFTGMAKATEGLGTVAGIESIIYPVLNFRSTVLVFMYSVAVSALATWLPSRRAAGVGPAEALRWV